MDETNADKIQRHADEDFTNQPEPQVLKVIVNISIDIEDTINHLIGVEMVNESIQFDNQEQANNALWKELIETYVENSIKNFNRTTDEQ